MSDSHIKGRRKTRVSKPVGIKMGKYLLPSNIAMPALMALLFAVIVAASAYEGGLDAVVLRLTGVALFAMLMYSSRARLKAMSFYTKLIDAFGMLFAATLLWSAVDYLHLYNPSTDGLSGAVLIAGVNLVLALVLVAALLYFEKERLASIYVHAGQLSSSLKIGVPVLAAGAVLAVALAYLFFGAGQADSSKLSGLFGLLIAFSVACGIAGEVWFRGLLLSRLLPIAGKQAGFIIQAAVFAFFQAGFYYLFTPDLPYLGAVLVVSLISGYVLAVLTEKHNTLLTAVLSGIGISLVLALPLFATVLQV